jgi:hypothetical protein
MRSEREQCQGHVGWLEAEAPEGQARESGRPAHGGAGRVVAGKLPEHSRVGLGRSQSAHHSEQAP